MQELVEFRRRLGHPGLLLQACLLTALLTGIGGVAHAGSDGRKGTAGATELLIPAGPRGTALGGTVASDVNDLEAMFWNPAGLAGIEGTAVMFAHNQYFADMRLNFAGIASRSGTLGVFGLGAKVLSVGDVVVTTEQAPDGTGDILHPTLAVLGLSWAKAFTDRVNFGLTCNYVSENIADNVASGLAFDFGVQYATDWHGFRMGMAMKNIGTSMKFTGPGFEILTPDPSADPNAGSRGLSFSSSLFEMPSYFSLSSSYNLMQNSKQRLALLSAYQNNNFAGDNVRAGLEWRYREMLALRGSYFGTFNGTTDLRSGEETFKFDSGDDLFSGVALGAGLGWKAGGSNVGMDVSWRPARELFDDIVEVGLHMKF